MWWKKSKEKEIIHFMRCGRISEELTSWRYYLALMIFLLDFYYAKGTNTCSTHSRTECRNSKNILIWIYLSNKWEGKIADFWPFYYCYKSFNFVLVMCKPAGHSNIYFHWMLAWSDERFSAHNSIIIIICRRSSNGINDALTYCFLYYSV